MAELGILPPSGLQIPQSQIDTRASYFDRTPIPAPIPSTAALSRAQGKAALYGSIADVLAKLPDTLINAYQTGKKIATGNATTNAYNAALAGNPMPGTALSDFRATGEGAVTYNPADPTVKTINDLKIDALKRAAIPKPVAPTLYEQYQPGVHPGSVALPSSDSSTDETPATTADASTVAASPITTSKAPGDLLNTMANGASDLSQFGLSSPSPFAIREGSQDAPSIYEPVTSSSMLASANAFGGTPLSDFQPALSDFQPAPQDDAPISVAEMKAMERSGQLPKITNDAQSAADNAAATRLMSSLNGYTPVAKPKAGAVTPQLSAFPSTPPAPQPADASATKAGVLIDPTSGVKTITQEDGAQFQIRPDAPNKMVPIKEASVKLDRDTQKRLNEANATGANITVAGKTPDEITTALAAWQAGAGTLTDAQISHVTHLRDRYTSMPIYHNAQNVIDGFHNATLAAQKQSGIGDKTLIEEGQRVLNPGNGVRAQTIQMFGGSSGLLERLSPSYIASHFEKGTILTPQQRSEYLSILDKAYRERTADMDEAAGQNIDLANMARVPEKFSTKYFDNPYKVSALRNGNPSAAGTSTAGADRSNPLQVKSPDDYAAAPSGTWVMDAKGNLGRKP